MPPAAFTEPIVFAPVYVERVWGGRRLAEAFGRSLPADVAVGEAWELVDRPDAQSVVAGGAHAGQSLHGLWREHREEVFGARGRRSTAERFPLLIKLIDARAPLSVQVHPPAEHAAALGGEPKSEAWWFLEADADAYVYAGLSAGVTRERFTRAYDDGEDVCALLHRRGVTRGDVVPIPNGRVHAIGPGCLILEVQQNSDTTYRVFDYGRVGLDGAPRELHVEASLRCIDWADHEPDLACAAGDGCVADEHFEAERVALAPGDARPAAPPGEAAVLTVLEGEVACGGRAFARGSSFLAPACAELLVTATGTAPAQVLRTLLAPLR